MQTLKFDELDATQKRLVSRLADEAGTLTSLILASTSHIGELWEAASFFQCYPSGTAQHEQIASRLRLGDGTDEGILDVIKHIAPDYVTLEQRGDAELDELQRWSKTTFTTP